MAHAADGVGVSKYNRLQQYALDMVTAITKLKAFMADYSRHRRRPPPHHHRRHHCEDKQRSPAQAKVKARVFLALLVADVTCLGLGRLGRCEAVARARRRALEQKRRQAQILDENQVILLF